jgi:dipeptidyl aminopeptidase/acylaminoacyl peptidase
MVSRITACPRRRRFSTTTRLHAKKVPTRLVWFPDENHWILKPQNSRLWYGEFFAWIEKYAKAGPIRPASKR